jgi:uncharacterized membrane protein
MAKDDEGKVFAIIAYVLGILGFLIVLLAKRDNKFAMYHAKQSLVLNIAAIVGIIAVSIVGAILSVIPYIGLIFSLLASLLILAVYIGTIVLWIIGIMNAAKNVEKPLPYIGQYAEKIKL